MSIKNNISSSSKSNDLVTVIIPKPINIVGDTETAVSLNGKIYQIQYDRPVSVPRNVAEIIEQSKDLQIKIQEITDEAVLRPGKRAIAEL